MRPYLLPVISVTLLACHVGCGTTKSQKATEQLLMSDAVDRSIASIDFRELAHEKVYLDTRYIQNVSGVGFVNADYIISSLRQQLMGAHCLLQDSPIEADYIVEARVGALGTDSHSVTYGVPANNALNAAASVLSSNPALPTIPEISVGRRDDQVGAAKIGVFAYHRETKEPVWQSGIARSESSAKNTWILGAGPLQRGTIYDKTQFAGTELRLPMADGNQENKTESEPPIAYDQEYHFPTPWRDKQEPVRIADQEGEKADGEGATETPRTAERKTEAGPRPTNPAASSGPVGR